MPVATTPGDASYVPILTLHGHSRSIAALAFSPCGLYIASAGADAALRVWRVGVHAASAGAAASASGAPDAALRTIRRAHELGINHLAWSSDGRYIATASDDRSVRVWDWRKVSIAAIRCDGMQGLVEAARAELARCSKRRERRSAEPGRVTASSRPIPAAAAAAAHTSESTGHTGASL
jgi:WD40 repeat protein